jgi:RsiW-degrading membrane proteinase PrsW (M82 family)
MKGSAMLLLALSLAPVLVILFYVYFRDKYEKEPLPILLKCFFFGMASTIPIGAMELFMQWGWARFGLPAQAMAEAAYKSFFVAGMTEELFKFMALAFLIWRRKEFNERFDGIVYAEFVSLGFAAIENLLYVVRGGTGVAVIRMFTAVPGHAVFGITMGYFFGLAKFAPTGRGRSLALALIVPIALHGFYDFILFVNIPFLLLLFIPYMGFLFRQSFQFMREHSNNSEFAMRPLSNELAANSRKTNPH